MQQKPKPPAQVEPAVGIFLKPACAGDKAGKCAERPRERRLRVGLRLAQAEHAIAFLPLPAFFEHLHALEAFQDIALGGDGAGTFETAMLRHKFLEPVKS